MSTSKTDDNFYIRADDFINLANKQCDGVDNSKVSSSLMFAAARFNAFIASSSAQDLEQLKRNKNAAIQFFTEQYTQMLTENLDENIKNYERNLQNS